MSVFARYLDRVFGDDGSRGAIDRAPLVTCADMWAIMPYALCSFRCTYCSAQAQGRSTPMLSQSELAQRIHAGVEKVDPDALLAIGLFSDPYPPIEAEHRLTRRAIEVLTELERRFVIVTKGTLVTRDIDLLVGNRYLHEVVISLFSHDDDHLRAHEPGAASFGARRAAVLALADVGIPTKISMAPWIPGMTSVQSIVCAFGSRAGFYVSPLDLADDFSRPRMRMSSARRTFGDHMSQLDIDRAYLREVMRLYDQAIWAFPITAREHCVARMSRFDVLRLVSELDAYAG